MVDYIKILEDEMGIAKKSRLRKMRASSVDDDYKKAYFDEIFSTWMNLLNSSYSNHCFADKMYYVGAKIYFDSCPSFFNKG
jgi:hypothetical protein